LINDMFVTVLEPT